MGKYKSRGKRVRDRFCADVHVCLALAALIFIIGGDELSKCSLKYEPTVFNINNNVKVGITGEFAVSPHKPKKVDHARRVAARSRFDTRCTC